MNTCLGSSNKFEDLFVPAIVFLAEPRLAALTQKVVLTVVAETAAGIVVAAVGTAAAAVAGIAAVVVGIAAAAEAGTESGTEIVAALVAGIVEQEVEAHFLC